MARITMEEKIKFITELLKDIGETQLSSKCGKYHTIVQNDDDSVAVISFKGRYGYEVTALEKLNEEVINIIYEDLREDFS